MRHWKSLTAAVALALAASVSLAAHAAGPTISISVSPASATISADDTQAYTVQAKDSSNASTDVTSASTVSVDDPLGSLTSNTYHPGKAGAWTIQAVYQSFTATAKVTVTAGALKELAINPNSDPEFVDLQQKKTFAVQGFDAHSNVVSGITPTWSVVGSIGTIDKNGVFTATTIGTGKVKVAVDTVTAEIPVVVKEATVTNSNANTNSATNANANTNSSANVNGANANGNTNATTNSNVNATNANTNSAGTSDDQGATKCTTLSTWLWVLILVVFLIAVSILYALFPVTKIWPAVIGLGGAIILVIVHRNYGCSQLAWWDWVMALVTLGVTILAVRQLPMPQPPQQNS